VATLPKLISFTAYLAKDKPLRSKHYKSAHIHSTKNGQRFAESGYDVSQTFITTFTCVFVSTLSASTFAAFILAGDEKILTQS